MQFPASLSLFDLSRPETPFCLFAYESGLSLKIRTFRSCPERLKGSFGHSRVASFVPSSLSLLGFYGDSQEGLRRAQHPYWPVPTPGEGRCHAKL